LDIASSFFIHLARKSLFYQEVYYTNPGYSLHLTP
jgi:hypothetical protein